MSGTRGFLALTGTVQEESIATTKGLMNLVCVHQHRLLSAWGPSLASGYCSGPGFPYAFLSMNSTSVC